MEIKWSDNKWGSDAEFGPLLLSVRSFSSGEHRWSLNTNGLGSEELDSGYKPSLLEAKQRAELRLGEFVRELLDALQKSRKE